MCVCVHGTESLLFDVGTFELPLFRAFEKPRMAAKIRAKLYSTSMVVWQLSEK